MNESNSQQNNNGISCDDFSKQMIDLADGTLSREESDLLMMHMENCPNCNKCYRLLMASTEITRKSQDSRKAYADHMTDIDRKAQILKINNLIRAEKNSKRQGFSKIFLLASRYRAFASTAAGIVILVFISYLFLSMSNIDLNNIFNKNFQADYSDLSDRGNAEKDNLMPVTGNSDNMQNESSDFKASEEMGGLPGDKSYGYDAQTAVTSGNKTEAASGSASASASASGSASASISSAVSGKSGSAAVSQSKEATNISSATGVKTYGTIYIAADSGDDLWKAMQGFVSYFEIKNDANNYLAIITYKKETIDNQKIQIMQITDKIGLTDKIEIISGENSQKLIEYISKENAVQLSNDAVGNGSDFLIISIGR